MTTFIACPDCQVPAEITDRFVLAGTGGPVDHVVLHCARGHCFKMASDLLPATARQQLLIADLEPHPAPGSASLGP